MSDVLGKFVWYDLQTTDIKAAIAFYTEVVGWKTEEWEGGGQPYPMWMVGDVAVGGVMELPPQARAMGAPPHWMAYIGTPDVDGTTDKAKGLGANVLVQPMDLPNVGRMAVLQDPQGAPFSLFSSAEEPPAESGPSVGKFSWHELMTTDADAAWGFYSELLGWKKTSSMDMGPEGAYQMYGLDAEHSLGGIMNKPADMPMAGWLYYVSVDDVKLAVERVKRNGGQVVNGPMEVPGGDWVAQCTDPQGAMFAVHSAA